MRWLSNKTSSFDTCSNKCQPHSKFKAYFCSQRYKSWHDNLFRPPARTITDFQTFETDLGSNFMPLSYTNITASFIWLVKTHFCLIDINEHKTWSAECCGTYWLPFISIVTPPCRPFKLFFVLNCTETSECIANARAKRYESTYNQLYSGISTQTTAFVVGYVHKIWVLDIWTVTNYIPFRITCQTCSYIKRKFHGNSFWYFIFANYISFRLLCFAHALTHSFSYSPTLPHSWRLGIYMWTVDNDEMSVKKSSDCHV